MQKKPTVVILLIVVLGLSLLSVFQYRELAAAQKNQENNVLDALGLMDTSYVKFMEFENNLLTDNPTDEQMQDYECIREVLISYSQTIMNLTYINGEVDDDYVEFHYALATLTQNFGSAGTSEERQEIHDEVEEWYSRFQDIVERLSAEYD
ncbi:hypothetical protein [Jeotgalibacillus aurantiacus]|uniref:hypothetical protein n=1 Tax=Jeotgalibacillus aurantiacus TaxID=2763266 RepID=UPI001D0BCB34|nr:hypothetical protein [Jeotgalibacillus aurantiacus]